jgi:tetratricopeptide (TPR) repeat protein
MFSWFKSFFGAKDSEISASDSSNFHEGLEAFNEGNRYFFSKDFNTALPYYDTAIQNNIEEGYDQRAMCLQALNYHVDALSDFDRAIELSPQDCNIYFMRAMSRIKLRDNAGAVSDMRAAIELSQVKNERNRAYNEGRIKNGESPLHDFYTLHLQGIEVMASLNEQMKRLNRPIPYDSFRRPT